MAYKLACKGVDCAHVVHGDTEDEVLQKGMKHMKDDHGLTDEQLSAPELLEEMKKLIKQVDWGAE